MKKKKRQKNLVLLRFTCPRRTQLGGLDEGRGRVGASSLVIALAKLADPPASALMALCLTVSGAAACVPLERS